MKFEVQYFNANTQSIHRKVVASHRLAAAIGKRLAIDGCRKVVVRRCREPSYDVWLIDSITERMMLIERCLEEESAVDWLKSWNQQPRDCICVLAPSGVRMPKMVTSAESEHA